jgi:hypothetical protein
VVERTPAEERFRFLLLNNEDIIVLFLSRLIAAAGAVIEVVSAASGVRLLLLWCFDFALRIGVGLRLIGIQFWTQGKLNWTQIYLSVIMPRRLLIICTDVLTQVKIQQVS